MVSGGIIFIPNLMIIRQLVERLSRRDSRKLSKSIFPNKIRKQAASLNKEAAHMPVRHYANIVDNNTEHLGSNQHQVRSVYFGSAHFGFV